MMPIKDRDFLLEEYARVVIWRERTRYGSLGLCLFGDKLDGITDDRKEWLFVCSFSLKITFPSFVNNHDKFLLRNEYIHFDL